MAKNILHTIEKNMISFSKGQKLIARYILDNYDKAAFMTASRLGKTVEVSESTVVRFATQLGYDGYPSMQRALQEMIRGKLTSIQRIQASDGALSGSDLATLYGYDGQAPVEDPIGPATHSTARYHATRGGCYENSSGRACCHDRTYCNASYTGTRDSRVGMRVAVSPEW